MSASHRRLPLIATCLALAACGGGGAGGTAGPGGEDSPIHVTAITVSGASAIPCTISVNGIADADRRKDTAWNATVPADGTHLPTYRDGVPYSATVTTTTLETAPAQSAFTIDIDP